MLSVNFASMDSAQKIEEVFLAPVGATLASHDTRIIERDGWYQIITPSSGAIHGNEVIYSRIAPPVVEVVLRRTIAEYADHGLPFRWCVGPLTEPAPEYFGALLRRCGFTWLDGRGMAIDPASWKASHAATDVAIEAVTPANVREYVEAVAVGWESQFDVATRCDDVVRAIGTGRFHYVMARVEGAIVGTAGFVVKPQSAYLVGGNVLPRYRGRGIYRALVDHRLERIRAMGIKLATTQARESTSAPILEALGFETVYRSRMYTLVDSRAAVVRLP